jgi:hypothetical protein
MAMDLSEELLDDIELSRLAAPDLVRKASRLARLLDDADALAWLSFEIRGYPEGPSLPADAWSAAERSGRTYYDDKEEGYRCSVATLSQLQASIEAMTVQLAAAGDAPVSITSANPHQHVFTPSGNRRERSVLTGEIASARAKIGKIVGAVHLYVSEQHAALRFGTAVESAFERVRMAVDSDVIALVPEAGAKFTAAFENVTSSNPEDWASAAATCRRLLKELADALQPAGPDIDGRKMGPDNYVNRLVSWIASSGTGKTARDFAMSDLEYLGRRLDAVADAGHKGAHAEVTQYEASRFIAGTYLLVGDILQLRGTSSAGGEATA